MKILYFYPEEKDNFMYFWQRVHFIDELSRNGIEVEILNPLDFNSLEESHEALLRQVCKQKYDLFFTSASLFINNEILSQIKQKSIPTLCFRPDNLLIPYIDKEIAASFDLIWLTSKETEHLYKKWGANYIFLPYAANPYTFQPKYATKINKICFIGTPYGSRSNMINTLINHGIMVDVFCKNQERKNTIPVETRYKKPSMSTLDVLMNDLRFKEGRKVLIANLKNRIQSHSLNEESINLTLLPKVPFESLTGIYSNYSLSLSSSSARHTDILTTPVPVVNLRAFEIPMSGGLQFCRYNEELANYFIDNKEIVFYKDSEEMVDKASFYLNEKNEKLISQMKMAARNKAESDHTWIKRFNKVFEILGLNCLNK